MKIPKTLNCRECGARLTFDQIESAKDICPVCKKETSWFSDPEFFGTPK